MYGRSLGSICAIHYASLHEVGGVILDSGIARPADFIMHRLAAKQVSFDTRPLEERLREMLDHKTKLKNYQGRLLILHTQDDQIVCHPKSSVL